MPTFDVGIVGGGCVGLATAYQLRDAGLKIIVWEKEAEPAFHQTGRNSGVMHSGIYYKPGSLKALNCIGGREEWVAFAQAHGVAHEVCGKIVVAADETEIPGLEKIYRRAHENGLTLSRKITPEEIREIEPECAGVAGIFVPYTGIIDYRAACVKMTEILRQKGHKVIFGAPVKALKRQTDGYAVHAGNETYRVGRLAACAGLWADKIARMDGLNPEARIVAFRGDYYRLLVPKVRHLIYPVPDPDFPFLGVHFTRMTNGETECGPNAVFSFKREGYSRSSFSFSDAWNALSFSGTRRFFAQYWQKGLREYRRAFSQKLFHKTLRRLVPSLQANELAPARSGVRALALAPNGELLDDFVFIETERSVHVLNAPSPAATAALAIGRQIAEKILNKTNS